MAFVSHLFASFAQTETPDESVDAETNRRGRGASCVVIRRRVFWVGCTQDCGSQAALSAAEETKITRPPPSSFPPHSVASQDALFPTLPLSRGPPPFDRPFPVEKERKRERERERERDDTRSSASTSQTRAIEQEITPTNGETKPSRSRDERGLSFRERQNKRKGQKVNERWRKRRASTRCERVETLSDSQRAERFVQREGSSRSRATSLSTRLPVVFLFSPPSLPFLCNTFDSQVTHRHIRLGSLLNLARLVVVNLLIVRFQTDVYEVWSFSFVAQKELILLF